MTPVQWLFHYLEIREVQNEKVESDTEVLKSLIQLFNSNIEYLANCIVDGAKISGAMANPEAGKALLEAEQLKEARADIADDEFCDWWEDFSSRIPGELKVETVGENVDLEGDAINLEKLYEMDMEQRRKKMKQQSNKE